MGETFCGWLMSDGYRVYRYYKKRLRCRAHLIRKARGLKESLSEDPRLFGGQALALFEELMEAVYKARKNSTGSLMPLYAVRLAEFKALCEQYRDCEHKKTRELAREFLYDWDAIWRVLEHPELPLTNNEAERALRHW
ncbi:MAG: transposase, partial [Gammaproteobacteria bacterium]|nr:transposase [Gammaproteobacteria bacterium]